ncbi:RNA-guided endonuclease InsQ/TnpB family protein [Nodularia sp. NIES-3585]|uniref:RNA-guided endonuclease InsQ/TnpB family protein n=1 Tax=Nodularia sp. NIES-3585 TaxID=1973477 RepID=UPI000B5C8725|nr:RNA-guided endonuclease TnpB family protein [Nodularia sp. NIES-3585]GAX34919.1 putative transposase IS605 family protein [Nodularia sp. NIES-3585]
MATKRVTFRLYPSKAQANKMHYWRRLHKDLYNSCVEHRRTSYKRFGNSVDYFNQQNCLPDFKEEWIEYKELGSHALQDTVKRVDFAFKRFLKLKSGYPKFKSSRHYKGWTYPCNSGWKAGTNGKNGYLKISHLGNIKMRGQARDWGKTKTCTIIFQQDKWYASITVDCVPTRPQTDVGAIGLDFGVYHAIAESNGNIIENPRFVKLAQDKINKIAKTSRRKKPPQKGVKASRRWRKANKAVAKIQSKVARQRQDWQHKVSTQIVSCNSLVATEKLNIKGMTRKAKKRRSVVLGVSPMNNCVKKGSQRKRQKTGLNRSLLDVGIGNLKDLIKYKVIEAGGFYIEIPTQKVKPSQTCPNCGHQKQKTLAERVHHCERCGYQCDRDIAAAMVILNYARGMERASTDADESTSTWCGSFKQVTQMTRRKRTSQS